ncbi:unnamed protein product [Symbiodinium sp. KB8]|nr:unnamed protein product [Symbiodinium sp. KB8]
MARRLGLAIVFLSTFRSALENGTKGEISRMTENSSTESLATQVQQAINVLRKAENRVSKIVKDQREKAARFAAYEKEVIAAHAVEERRHATIQDKLATELLEATKQVEAAKQVLAASVPTLATGPMEVTQESAQASWERMQQRNPSPTPRTALDPDLLEVLRAYKNGQIALSAPAETRTQGPGPVLRGQEMAVEQARIAEEAPPNVGVAPPAYGPASPSAHTQRTAPYTAASPTAHHPAAEPAPPTMPEATDKPAPPRMRPKPPVTEEGQSRLPERSPVKEASKKGTDQKTPAPSTLQAKLDAKRATMRPFGQAVPQVVITEATDTRPPDLPPDHAPRENPIIDDDEDELTQGVPSPGFGNLE